MHRAWLQGRATKYIIQTPDNSLRSSEHNHRSHFAWLPPRRLTSTTVLNDDFRSTVKTYRFENILNGNLSEECWNEAL